MPSQIKKYIPPTEGDVIVLNPKIEEEGGGVSISDAPRLVVGHEKNDIWLRLIGRDGMVNGPFSFTHQIDDVNGLLKQNPSINRNVIVNLSPADFEIKLNETGLNKDAISMNLASKDILQLTCNPAVISSVTSEIKKLNLIPISIETWVAALPKYYTTFKKINDAVVTLVFNGDLIDILLSQDSLPMSYFRLSIKPDLNHETKFECFKKDIAIVLDFFEKRFSVKIEHFASWNAPESWLIELSETYDLKGVFSSDEEFYNGIAIGSSIGSVKEVEQSRFFKSRSFNFKNISEKVSASLTKVKTFGVWGLLISFIAAVFAIGVVLEIRTIAASSMVKKWDRSRADLNDVLLRSNKVEFALQRIASINELINQNKESISLSSSIASIGQDIPGGVFLTQVGYTGGEVTISGVSTSWENFLMMMERLSHDPSFSRASPAEIKRLTTGAVQFQVVVVPKQVSILKIGGIKP